MTKTDNMLPVGMSGPAGQPKREQFVFYRAFWDAIKGLPAEKFRPLMDAIVDYGLNRTEPHLPDDLSRVFYAECRPLLERDWRKFVEGYLRRRTSKKGGAQ